jgi:hypothetical protein
MLSYSNNMPTIKQKLAIEKFVENRGNMGAAMIQAGYDTTTAKNPKNLTNSKGYKVLLGKYGLTESLVTRALVEDIKAKKGNRTAELNLGAELLGMKKKEAEIVLPDSRPTYKFLFSEEVREDVRIINERIKDAWIQSARES